MMKILVVDAFNLKTRTLKVKSNPECILCGISPTITTIESDRYTLSCTASLEIDCQTFKTWKDKTFVFQLLDVRESDEWNYCKLPESKHLPLAQLPKSFEMLSRTDPIVLYCHHGARSLYAAQLLKSQGFDKVYSLKGGIDEWALTIDTSIKRY